MREPNADIRKQVIRLRLTNDDLKTISKNLGSRRLPIINLTKENAEMLQSIVDELVEKRETQEKLIELLGQADDYSERLEWKLMMMELPSITETVLKNRKKREEDAKGF